ncbi:MAG: sodium:alanine symporter family protein [Firmicutes bacterium]|nr:sodium:alanine symporter family protein [Bacillota bacterium]MDY6161491.1 sodium:alanine symporter family protein [Candidatus Faecousia sp.]
MTHILDRLYGLLWGGPMLVLISGVGVWLTICTRCAQVRLFPQSLRRLFRKSSPEEGGVSPFRALCTALAATVGTGNLVGVAGAICLGGPGSVFWMMVFAFFGMAVKFAEAALAIRFRETEDGELVGGPMYMIRARLSRRFLPLAYLYSLCGILASFGVGNMTQVNAIITGIQGITPRFSPLTLGLAVTILVGLAFLKGADSIGRIAEKLIPIASGIYILLCVLFLVIKAPQLPGALSSILTGAFSPKAVTGGLIGSAFKAVQTGCSRGVFTHEAGMGTASIAHASANVRHPAEQGMMGLLEVFLDTFVICTLTALVILCSGIPIPYGTDAGANLTTAAFSAVYGRFGKTIVCIFLVCFAYATILGWSFYGLRCTQFVFGKKAASAFFLLQTAAVLLGAVMKTPQIWRMAEILNGLMALPNLLMLLVLSPELRTLTNSYKPESSIHNWR